MLVILTHEQYQKAVELLRDYLAAPPTADDRSLMEVEGELDNRRVSTIENELQPLVISYLSGGVALANFKTKVDSINKRNELWGFKGIKGQMFFNLVLNIAEDESECDREMKAAIGVPPNQEVASARIKNFANYIQRIGDQYVESGGSKHGKPSISSVPFFLSYFWQIQNRNVWPVYYTNSVNVMSDLELWHPTGDLAMDYRLFMQLHEELIRIFTVESGQRFSLYDVEHVFWFKGGDPYGSNKPIIKEREDDDDTEEDQTDYEGGSIYPYEMPEEVDIREDPQTVFEWIRRLKKGKLIIDPEFQRNLVWRPEQKSQFIESVLLNIPLPPLYVNQKKDGRYIIVDGLQRTSTLDEFISYDKFELSKLKVLTHLNGLKYSQLDSRFQTRIEDKKFLVYVIKPTVPIQMVYDIFHRINTGGTQLTRQEIRNCFYIGPSTRLLKELSEQPYFRRAITGGISPKRMKDREAILRCLAFRILNYRGQYKNDMDAFLGEALNQINVMDERHRATLQKDFERVMIMTYDFWEDRNFRLPTSTTRGRINIALMESIYFFFSMHRDEVLLRNRDAILSNYNELLKNESYIDAIQFATGDTKRVVRRFDLAQEVLGRF